MLGRKDRALYLRGIRFGVTQFSRAVTLSLLSMVVSLKAEFSCVTTRAARYSVDAALIARVSVDVIGDGDVLEIGDDLEEEFLKFLVLLLGTSKWFFCIFWSNVRTNCSLSRNK